MMWLPDHHHCITGGSFLFYKNIFTNPHLNWGFMSCLFGDQLKLLAKIITPINLKGFEGFDETIYYLFFCLVLLEVIRRY